ncbi:unnamed protein product, partial [Owenia fusiformis]
MEPISTRAMVRLLPFNSTNNQVHVMLDVHQVAMQHRGEHDHAKYNAARNMDFTNWFHFRVNCNGEADKVWYPPNEENEVVNIKKAIVSHLSARLHMSNMKTRPLRWAYYINETDSTGNHLSMYNVTDMGDKLMFEKHKSDGHTTAIPNSDGYHKKMIEYHKVNRVPERIVSEVNFTAPNKPIHGNEAETRLPGDPSTDHGPGWANDL